MKYSRLTKEQFEELHPEFTNFLAAQSIDKNEWDKLKTEQPHIAEQELDVFSDLIWEGVLTKAEYLEQFSVNYIFLFHCGETQLHSIVLRALKDDHDFTTREGLQWLSDNLFTDTIEIKLGKKPFGDDRNMDIFGLIKQGTALSDGRLYKHIDAVIRG